MQQAAKAWYLRENRWIAALTACGLALFQFYIIDVEGALMTSVISQDRAYDSFWDLGPMVFGVVLIAVYLSNNPRSMSSLLVCAFILVCSFLGGAWSYYAAGVTPRVTAVAVCCMVGAFAVAVAGLVARRYSLERSAAGLAAASVLLGAGLLLTGILHGRVISYVSRADGGASTRPFDSVRIAVYVVFAVVVFGAQLALNTRRRGGDAADPLSASTS
ncbi:MAG: hypothetical protein KDB90_17485 [Planctomycetes bacterium]|nr:hypothetical protein [Planctomycetota bacterium]